MRRAVIALTVWLMAVPAWAENPLESAPEGRFHLLHDIGEVLTLTWGGVQTAFALPTLSYLLPAAAVVGGSSFADDQVQAHFKGHNEHDGLARAGEISAWLYYGPVQAGVYMAGELSDNVKLSDTGKKAMASLLGAQSIIQPLKYLTRRRRPDGSNRQSFPSAAAGAASSIIPAVYHEYGLVPATVTAVSAAFIGFSRIYGNQHHLSDVLAGYAIGLGWGILVETYERHQSRWSLLPMSDGRTMAGLELHLRFD
jgi:membrane-associated phospholipid phosphatase